MLFPSVKNKHDGAKGQVAAGKVIIEFFRKDLYAQGSRYAVVNKEHGQRRSAGAGRC